MRPIMTLVVVVRDKDLDPDLKILFLRPTAGWKSYSARIWFEEANFKISS